MRFVRIAACFLLLAFTAAGVACARTAPRVEPQHAVRPVEPPEQPLTVRAAPQAEVSAEPPALVPEEGVARSRALLLAPPYAWSDTATDLANVVTSLAQAGIAFDRPATNASNWASTPSFEPYALIVIPGYLLSSVLAPVREKLEAFVARGGVLIVFKPMGDDAHPEALELAGLRTGTRHRGVDELRIDGAASAATRFVDSVEERSLSIHDKAEKVAVEVWTYEPNPQVNTSVLVTSYQDGAAIGATMTRRALGKGAVYAVGHDLASFGKTRCYVNCFEPAGDVMRLFFEFALREGSAGHAAMFATTPALSRSVLVLSHDLTTRETMTAGAWGEAGGIQFAKVEKQRGIHATFHLLTDYRNGSLSTKMMRQLCELGVCTVGIQGTTIAPTFARMGDGMVRDTETSPWRCKETFADYTVPSLCGEVLLSSQLVQYASKRAPRAWRSPRLGYHPALIQVLASAGIAFDSSFGIGDLPYNVPLDLATTGVQQRRFHRRPLLEFPLSCDDGIDVVNDGIRERIELQPSTEARFREIWDYVVLQNLANQSFTTLRINPSRGEKLGPENVQAKALILGRFLDDLARLHPDVAVRSVEEAGDFWRARNLAKLDVRFEKGGYTGSLKVGKATTPGLTIEFGDAIKTFDCPTCGETKIDGKRVSIVSALPPDTHAAFSATTR